jgi:hypothetical protein
MTSQTPDMQAVLERLERLERQYRRLKRTGLATLTAVAALVLMAQATPKSKTLEAQELILRDSGGKLRASFGAYRDGPRLTLYGENGKKQTELLASSDGSSEHYAGLVIYNSEGKVQASLRRIQTGTGLDFVDQHGKARATLCLLATGPQLVLTDDDGKPRLGMLVRDGSPLLQAEDANGKVTWSAPDKIASQIAARPDKRPRVFIEVWGKPPSPTLGLILLNEHLQQMELEWERLPISRQPATEEMATFAQACPDAVATIDQQKADYTLRLDSHFTFTERVEEVVRFSLFGADGSLVSGNPTFLSLRDAVAMACRGLLTDWGARNFRAGGPAETAQPASNATVAIKSTPDGADITVNGKFAGMTPSTLKLPPGDYALMIQRVGFKAWNRTLTLSSGASISVDTTLEKGP